MGVLRRGIGILAIGLTLMLLDHPAAAQGPDGAESDIALRGVVIPTGFQAGKYSALVQVAVHGSPLPNATWELGASFVSADQSRQAFSGRVIAERPGTPVVYEFPVEFAPGSHSLILDARETTAGQGGTRELDSLWPNPGDRSQTITPVVLLQPAQGAFLRGEDARAQGALALEDGDPVSSQLPTALVSVVCRGAHLSGFLRVARELEGASPVEFETIDVPPGDDPCVQVRDIIPSGSMGGGHFRYKVELMTPSGMSGMRVLEFSVTVGAPESRPGS